MMKLFKTDAPEISGTESTENKSIFVKLSKQLSFAAVMISSLLLLTEAVPTAWAITGQELEKPKPVFTRNGDEISAQFIPRAKSSSVIVKFKVNKGGKLIDVKGMDFEKAERPEVDIKNYKSALFIIDIGDVKPAGSDATVTISSDFFASGTEYRVFNEKLPSPWINSECQNLSTDGRVRELVVTVKDGGPFDSDGEVNGAITFVGGPRDSFWGYALGTLFIRFFGIFLVLSVLMIGMIISGLIFSRLESRKPSPETESDDLEPVPAEIEDAAEREEHIEEEPYIETDTAAAIAVALHLHLNQYENPDFQEPARRPSAGRSRYHSSEQSSWSNQGREQLMRERSMAYNRGNR